MDGEREDIGAEIKIIHDCLRKCMDKNMRDCDLTFSQMRVLHYLHLHGGETVYQKDIEEAFSVSHPTINGILKRLAQKDFVKLGTDSTDRRMKTVMLTDRAENMRLSLVDSHDMLESRITEGLTDAQVSELRKMLSVICGNMKQLSGEA